MLPETSPAPADISPPLERFRRAKQKEISLLQQAAEQDRLPLLLSAAQGLRPSFTAALRHGCTAELPAVIAEYKRASPSRGIIRADLQPEDVALQYAASGAACMSILTEEQYFQGSLGHMERVHEALTAMPPSLPLLRKDFIFDPLQVRQTAASPAAALLLIVRLTPRVSTLRALREAAEGYGLEAVVEVCTAQELAMARQSGASLLQVNARDLDTFIVDTESCLQLARHCRHQNANPHECWIAASGIRSTHDLRTARQAGYDAVLVGTALMEQPSPGTALRALLGGAA